ncbi:MAG: aminoacyl-tRNA hydrolase [Minwuiales bacterium]|nr:aminoacyl-tRNA hydrolase [Minwuiales bacterium]
MIEVTPEIWIDERDIDLQFIRASGPGGQNVNQVATAVQLRFDVAGCRGLTEPVRKRLIELAGRRVNADGVLVIDARRFRTQNRNRQDAMDRLLALLREAAVPPRPRRRTKPSKGSVRRRLDRKRQRSETKRGRGRVGDSDF